MATEVTNQSSILTHFGLDHIHNPDQRQFAALQLSTSGYGIHSAGRETKSKGLTYIGAGVATLGMTILATANMEDSLALKVISTTGVLTGASMMIYGSKLREFGQAAINEANALTGIAQELLKS